MHLFACFNTNIVYSVHLFCIQCFFESICFRMFCLKHSITFENTYILSCWFHCVDIFYIKFRSCETWTVIAIDYWLKHCINLEPLSVELPRSCYNRKVLNNNIVSNLFPKITWDVPYSWWTFDNWSAFWNDL